MVAMGKGSVRGSVKDWFKKRGQRTHGELGKRQRLSAESEKRRKQWKAERRAERRDIAKLNKGSSKSSGK